MGNEQAVVFERNKMVHRRIARILTCAGWEVRSVEQPESLDAAAIAALVDPAQPTLLVADGFDLDLVCRAIQGRPRAHVLLYTGEPDERNGGRLLQRALEEPRIVGILGRASFEAPPREADLLAVAAQARGGPPIPFEAQAAWGASAFAYAITDAAERDGAVREVIAFTARLGAPKRVGEMLGELAHELIMNALYDAPVDGAGRPLYAHDRKAEIRVAREDAAVIRCASDGVRLAIEVTDRFGRLERQHVFGGLVRALKSGQMDQAGGGAGLGMMVAYRSTTALFFDVVRGQRTRVTGLFELDLNLREFKQLPKTIHFPVVTAG
jgi:hypothetical protein